MVEQRETVRKRRRWLWVILGSLVLLIGGSIAWQLRPLNATERALVGRWSFVSHDESFEFRSDRYFVAGGGTEVRSWNASENTIAVQWPVSFAQLGGGKWTDRLATYFKRLSPPVPTPFNWVGPDRIVWGGKEFVRIREEATGR